MPAAEKKQVSERALYQRINRKLAPGYLRFCAARGFSDGVYHYENSNLGRYYVLDILKNWVIDHHLNIETYAQDLGVLKEDEEMTPS